MVSIRMLIGLLIVIFCAAVFAVAFYKMPIPGVCGLFPSSRPDTIVRYYVCSLALCVNGCSWVEQPENKICLERDCTTKECRKWCDYFCDHPPSTWPQDPKGSGPNETCGRGYNLSLSLEGMLYSREG